MPTEQAKPQADQPGPMSAAELFSQLFPDGIQMTGELLADLAQWARLTSKLTAGHCCTLLLHQDPKRPVAWSQPAAELGGRYWDRTSDLLGVNELHGGRCWSLVQLTGLLRSYEVGTGRRGCCTYLLYCRPALLNFGIRAA